MRSLRAAAALLAFVALVLAGCGGGGSDAGAAPGRATGPVTWIALSDIHFDPFADGGGELVGKLAAARPAQWATILAGAGSRLGGYGEDTDYPLLASTLKSVTKVRRPQVAIVTGDLLAHEFEQQYDTYAKNKSKAAYDAFVDKTIAFLSLELGAALPRTQFVFALGNSDSYCGDYELEPGGAFLAHTARSWRSLVARGAGAPSFGAEFPELGSYVARMPVAGGRFVALNDVYWSRRYQDACGSGTAEPGAAEMAWLEGAVKSAPAGRPLWLLMHIPPGIDVYASTHSAEPVPTFAAGFEEGLTGVLGTRSFAAGVAGHLHMSTWRLVPPGPSTGATPVLGVPSISPVFENNPAYLVLKVNPKNAGILDYTAYTLDLSAPEGGWTREYSFDGAYGVRGFDAAALRQVQGKLRDDQAMRAKWERYYNSGSGRGGIDETNYRDFLCGNVALAPAQYAVCTSPVTAGRQAAGP
jgi:sphingomyelin phosphodiesterase acid-like 3